MTSPCAETNQVQNRYKIYEFSCVISTEVRNGNDIQNVERHVEITDVLYKPL
jgi:hypothetical protein